MKVGAEHTSADNRAPLHSVPLALERAPRVAQAIGQHAGSTAQASQLQAMNNSPQAEHFRLQQQAMNNSHQARQLQGINSLVNNNFQSRQFKRLQTRTAGPVDNAAAPIQRVSRKDYTEAFAVLKDFRFENEADATRFWTETVEPHVGGAASDVYFCYLSLSNTAMNKEELEAMLVTTIDVDDVTKAQCEAFVAGVNAALPKPEVAAMPEFMSMFMAQEVGGGKADPAALKGIVKEFIEPLSDVVAMRPTPEAALAGAQVILMISERIGAIAQLAIADDPDSVAIINALNQCGFMERLINILALQDDPTRVLCHETEIARPLINALANAKAPGVKLSVGTEVPVEEDLAARAMVLFKKLRKECKAK